MYDISLPLQLVGDGVDTGVDPGASKTIVSIYHFICNSAKGGGETVAGGSGAIIYIVGSIQHCLRGGGEVSHGCASSSSANSFRASMQFLIPLMNSVLGCLRISFFH
jgi:hypothetical protein